MLNRDDLTDLHEMIPGIVAVTLIPLGEDSKRGDAITVSAAESRPMSSDSKAYVGIDIEQDAQTWHLWVATFSSPVRIRKNFLIREADGTEWVVANASLEMMKTRWRCDCAMNYGIIP